VESGLLADEPYYAAAVRISARYSSSPQFARFALMSADTNAINSALQDGSQATDLETAPAGLFIEPATPEGLEKAQHFLSGQLSETQDSPDKKP
jgi:hypothetical protein